MNNTIFIINNKTDFDFLNSLALNVDYCSNVMNLKSSLIDIDTIIVFQENNEFADIHMNTLNNNLLKILDQTFYSKNLYFISISKSISDMLLEKYSDNSKDNFSLLLDFLKSNTNNLHKRNTLNQDSEGCYIILEDKKNKSVSRINLCNFNILDATNIKQIDAYGNISTRIEILISDIVKKQQLKYETLGNILLKKDDLNALLATKSNTIDYYSYPKYLVYLKRYITNIADKKDWEKIITEQNGIVKLDNKFYYVTPEGAMDSYGNITKQISSQSISLQYNSPNLYNTDNIDNKTLSTILKHLFNYTRDKVSLVTLILWSVANFYKYRYELLKIGMCDLFIFSLSGSGKDESVNNIISPLYNLERDKRINLGTGSASKATVLLAPCYNTFTPVIYNEFGNASFEISETIKDLCKSRYDRNDETRSNTNFEVNKFPNYNSPVVVLGENGFDSSQQSLALSSRHIIISLTKSSWDDSTKNSYNFIKDNSNILSYLGEQLLLKVLNTSDEEILIRRKQIYDSIESKFSEIQDRVRGSLVTLLHGYTLLEDVCNNNNINISDYLTYNDAMQSIADNIYKNNIGDKVANKNQIDISIEELLNYLHRRSRIQKPWRFNEGYLCIPIAFYLEAYRNAKNVPMLKKEEFNKYIKQYSYVQTFKNSTTLNYHARAINIPGYNDDKPVTSYWFDISKIKNLDSFIALKELI